MRKFRTVISLIVLVCFVFSLSGCSSKSASLDDLTLDKVKDILEKKMGATEYDYSYNDGNLKRNDYEYFKDGYYITDGNDGHLIDIINYSGVMRGNTIPHYYVALNRLNKAYQESGTGFVMYKTTDRADPVDDHRYTGQIGRSALMIYVQFESDAAAMECFEDMTANYFGDSVLQRYEIALNSMSIATERYKGTILGDWISKSNKGQQTVKLQDVDKSVYSREGNKAHFNYSLHWDITRFTDLARGNPDDLEKVEKYSFFSTGVSGFHLRVDGSRLLLIDGTNFTTNKGEVNEVKKLCKAFSTDNPFDAKMSTDLKYQLLFFLNYWTPAYSRVDDVK